MTTASPKPAQDFNVIVWFAFVSSNLLVGALGYLQRGEPTDLAASDLNIAGMLLLCGVVVAFSLAVHWSLFSSKHLDQLQILKRGIAPDGVQAGGLIRTFNMSMLDEALSPSQQLAKIQGNFMAAAIVKYSLNELVAIQCFLLASRSGLPELALAGASIAVVLQLMMFPRLAHVLAEMRSRGLLQAEV